MKEGWDIRRLGDICTIERGGSPRPITAYITDAPDGINWIKIGDAREGSKYITSTAEKIKPEGMKKSRFVHKGDFILSNSMSFGRPYIMGVDGCIHDGWLVIRDENNTFNKSFLYYYLGSPTIYKEFSKLAVGGVVSNLNSNLVRGVKVVIPPIAEQEKIVAELACLTGIIEKKKQQLKELDKLAQSIFYDMFGTSLKEKGFPVKMMGEIGTFQRGAGLQKKDFVNGGMPCIHYGQIHTAFGSYTTKHLTTIPKDLYAISKIGHPGDLLMVLTSEDVEGSCKSTAWLGEYDVAVGSDAAIFSNHSQNAIYLSYCTRTRSFFNEKSKYANGFKVTHIKTGDIGKIPIAIPPRALQDLFAQKIEAIEKQKEQIKKSIQETETLFNSRMDYWFN